MEIDSETPQSPASCIGFAASVGRRDIGELPVLIGRGRRAIRGACDRADRTGRKSQKTPTARMLRGPISTR